MWGETNSLSARPSPAAAIASCWPQSSAMSAGPRRVLGSPGRSALRHRMLQCQPQAARRGRDRSYYQHRVDPKTPIEAPLVRWPSWSTPGRYLPRIVGGCSGNHPPRVNVHPSPRCKPSIHSGAGTPEAELMPTVRELGVASSPTVRWGGDFSREVPEVGRSCDRRHPPQLPRFQGENFQKEPRFGQED